MKGSVMVVDDDRQILVAISDLLRLEDFEVVSAGGGEECIAALEEGFKGVILLDVMMPQMDGWDTIREMVDRGLADGNVIAMLTARDTPDCKMTGLEEVVVDYITKPFDPDKLVTIVESYLAYIP